MREATHPDQLVGYQQLSAELAPTPENLRWLDAVAGDLAGVDAKWFRDAQGRVSFWRRETECLDGDKHQRYLCKENDPPHVASKNF